MSPLTAILLSSLPLRPANQYDRATAPITPFTLESNWNLRNDKSSTETVSPPVSSVPSPIVKEPNDGISVIVVKFIGVSASGHRNGEIYA